MGNTLKRLKKDGCILHMGLLFTDRKTPCNAFSRNLVNDTVQKVSCACETRTVTQRRSKVAKSLDGQDPRRIVQRTLVHKDEKQCKNGENDT